MTAAIDTNGVRLPSFADNSGDTLEERTRRVLRHLVRPIDADPEGAVHDMLASDDWWAMADRIDPQYQADYNANPSDFDRDTYLPWSRDTLIDWAILEHRRWRCRHKVRAIQAHLPGIKRTAATVCADCGKDWWS